MLDITTHVRGIFTDAQHSMQARTKLVSRLQKVVEDSDAEEFFEMFTNCLKHSLVVFTRDPAVERTIDFIVAFATTESKGDRLLQKYKQVYYKFVYLSEALSKVSSRVSTDMLR